MSPELFADMANRKKELIVNLAAEHSAHSRDSKQGVFAQFPPSHHPAGTKEMRARTWRHLAPCSDFLFITFMTVMTKLVGKI